VVGSGLWEAFAAAGQVQQQHVAGGALDQGADR
jgi:hypothetical protein